MRRLLLVICSILLPTLSIAATPEGARRLSSSRMFQITSSGQTFLCGNLPPWVPGRMVNGLFYPTATELAAQRRRARALSGAALVTARQRISSLAQRLSRGGPICRRGPPSSVRPTPTPLPPSNARYDSQGNVTAAGKIAFGIPSNLSASVGRGMTAWALNCNGCHNIRPSALGTKQFPLMRVRVQQSPMSFSIPAEITDQQIADIIAYANY